MICHFDKKTKILTVEASEHGTREDLDAFLDEAVSHFHAHGKLKLVLDWLHYTSNSVEVEKAGMYVSASMKTMFSKIAVICKPQQREQANNWKATTSLNIKIYRPEEHGDMIKWLKS